MPQVSIRIANRTYELACGAGEQERVRELASYVDEKVGELQKQMPTGQDVEVVFPARVVREDDLDPVRPRRQINRAHGGARLTRRLPVNVDRVTAGQG